MSTSALRATIATLIILASILWSAPIHALQSETPPTSPCTNGVVLNPLSGVITVRRQDAPKFKVDYVGSLCVDRSEENILIKMTSAGIVRKTGETITIDLEGAGATQRVENKVRFNLDGIYTIEREDGTQIVIDVIGAGVIGQKKNSILIDVIGAGVVSETGEQILIDVIGAGIVGE